MTKGNIVPFVAVLILSYNGKNLLDDSVQSYLDNNYDNSKVVVIDNGSTDGTQDYVTSKWQNVTVLRSDVNLKYSGGFNIGLDYAFHTLNADYVLISNNDVEADKEVIRSLVNTALNNINAGFITGKVFYYDKRDVFQTTGKKYDDFWWMGPNIGRGEQDVGQYDSERELEWCDDIFWLVSKELYFTTGGYDTEFDFQAEDFDWQVRAKNSGFKIFFSPNAKIWHKESSTIGKISPMKAYYDARNSNIVHMKYRRKDQYLAVIKKRRNIYLKASVKYFLKGEFRLIIKTFQGYLSSIKWGKKNGKL